MDKSETDVRVEHLFEIAKAAYARALADFYFPPLPKPAIEYDPDSASFFYIDSDEWAVHLNLTGVPLHLTDEESFDYLRGISHHELQHYLLCPYDDITSGMMFARARRHVDDEHAMFVCNLFADLVVDSHLLNQFPRLAHDRITLSIHDSATRMKEHSKIWELIVCCYRVMWGFPIPPVVQVDPETYALAEKIVEVTRAYINKENKWHIATEKIAELLEEWLPKTSTMGDGIRVEAGPGQAEKTVFVPLDVDAIMGSPIENRSGDRARKCNRQDSEQSARSEMERMATEVEARGGNLEDLEGVLLLAGFGDARDEWLHFWYRAKARSAVRFEIKKRVVTGATPLVPELWRLGDPVEELDIVQSLQAFPVLVPNMSTRKWLRVTSFGEIPSKDIPDMLIVIDSSGSMSYNLSNGRLSGIYHLAIISAFSALDFAMRTGRRAAAINFSSGFKTCDWTNERMEVEKIILSYQGSGTVAPVKKIKELCEANRSDVMIIMITDAEIYNWDSLVSVVRDRVRHGDSFFLFHIGAKKDKPLETHRELSAVGGNVIPVPSAKALVGLVVREVREVYQL